MNMEKNNIIPKKELGQVFTPSGIVTYMVKQLEGSIKYIIEPSAGDGAFLKSLLKISDVKIKAIELDPSLVEHLRNNYDESDSLDIHQGSFFNFDFSGYDAVIMNPPYVRHEELANHFKESMRKSILQEKVGQTIPSQSNLYVYFFVKSLSCLKEGGQLLAIIPSNWMSAKYGEWFKMFIQKNFHIKEIVLMKEDVFDGALTDSCILHLTKKKRDVSEIEVEQRVEFKIGYMESGVLKTQKITEKIMDDISTEEDWGLYFRKKIPMKDENFLYLTEIFDIKRGIGTNWNSFFIFKQDSILLKKYPSFFQRLVTSPKNLSGYSTSSIKMDEYLLSINDDADLPKGIRDYIEKHSKILKEIRKPKTVFEKLESSPNGWYRIQSNLKVPDFLFSYIVRENKKFYLNDARYLVRDNFYELYIKEKFKGSLDIYVLMSILNSIVSEYNLEFIGRNQGGGLKKIQKYEFEKLKIINPSHIKLEDYKELQILGEKLTEKNQSDTEEMIKKRINEITWPYYNPKKSLKCFERNLENETRKRLRR